MKIPGRGVALFLSAATLGSLHCDHERFTEDGGISNLTPDASNSCALDGGSGSLCSGVCVNLMTDQSHCGSCATACGAAEVCISSACHNIAGSLNGLKWLLPCIAPAGTFGCWAHNPPPVSTTLQGTAGVSYDVTLHFRGVVETKSYSGGTNDGAFWQVGGQPISDTYNWYKLQISDPPQTYYLNRGVSFLEYCFKLDYSKTLRIKAGAVVTLTEDTVDDQEVRNRDQNGHPITVPGVSPSIVQPFDGQFIEMQVTSVVPVP